MRNGSVRRKPYVKDIGKPCAGEPHARFDEGALRKHGLGTRSSGVRRGVSNTERAGVSAESVLYSTRISSRISSYAPGSVSMAGRIVPLPAL